MSSYSGCYSSYFTAACSNQGICVNDTCLCEPGWGGEGIFFGLNHQDCPVHLPTLQILHILAACFSFVWALVSFIGLLLIRTRLKLCPLVVINADKIMVSHFIWQLLSTILFSVVAAGYNVYQNYGSWVICVFYMNSFILYLYLAINFMVTITYKLKKEPPPISEITGVLGLFCGLASSLLLLGTVINRDFVTQILIIRLLMGVWLITGTSFGITIFYYGWRIEMVLQSNEEENSKTIKSIRKVRFSFVMVLAFFMVFYAACLALPVLLLWIWPISLSFAGGPTFIFWHIGIIRKKLAKIPSTP